MDSAEELKVPLNALIRASKTYGECIRAEKGFHKLVKVIHSHKDKPAILQTVMEILYESLKSTSSFSSAALSACEMSKAGVVQEIVDVLTMHLQNEKDLIRSTVVLTAQLANDWLDHDNDDCLESFRRWCCIDIKLLTAVIAAMKQHIHDEVICDAGTYVVFWFECAENEDVRRAVRSDALNIAIEAALSDHAGKLKRNDDQDLEKFLTIPKLLSAIHRDPVMGTLRKAYELHKDKNEVIAKYGREVQFAVIERQKCEAKLFCCMNHECNKQLAKKERLICTRCRSAIFCSKDCQIAAWKNGHKTECKKVL